MPSPTVLWVSGRPDYGKTHFGKLLEARGIKGFDTDTFVCKLPDWCPDAKVAEKARRKGPNDIGGFLEEMVREKKAVYMAQLLLDPNHGFKPDPVLSVIYGYMPTPVQDRVMAHLEIQGCYVWLAMRPEQFDWMRGLTSWKNPKDC